MTLTPAGQVLLRHARAVCHEVGQLRAELDEYSQGHGGTVRVQANTAATESVVSAAAVSFLAMYPHARIDLETHAMPLGTQPRYRVRLPSIDAACHAVAEGIGIAILPACSVRRWLTSGAVAATATALVGPWAARHLVACFTSDRDLSDTARALRDHLLTHAHVENEPLSDVEPT